jgi:[acyl-carrier-protein] S-malonyltransferase
VSYALLFPGQASQQVGMGADFRRRSAAARAIYQQADLATGRDLTAVVDQGPLQTLTDTRYAQPAVVATSLAALEALREATASLGLAPPAFCAGHSVGELAAAAAAGAIDVQTALHLVARRADLMAEICDRVEGTMAAVLGLERDDLEELCLLASAATGERVELANLNAPDQLVVSGHRSAVQWLVREGPTHGARRVIPLTVGGPFHSSYMRSAVAAFGEELRQARILPAQVPIVLNQTAVPSTDPDQLRRELAEQIAAPVRWSDGLRYMTRAGCRLFVEVGPGQVLAGLARRTVPEVEVLGVQDQASLERAVTALSRPRQEG